MNKFDMQIQCEEFYTENCLTEAEKAEILDDVVVVSCYSAVEETMDTITEMQMMIEDAESYLVHQVDSDDYMEHTRVINILITYQEILDELKSFSWVAPYFADEPAKRRYYDCNGYCPFKNGEQDVNSCTCGCALFTEDGQLLHH